MDLGQFIEFDHPNTISPVPVHCSKPCLVVQYNKGTDFTMFYVTSILCG